MFKMASEGDKTRDTITTVTYVVIIGVVGYLVYQVIGALSTIAKQGGAAVTSATGAASNTVQGASDIWNGFLGMLGFSQTDPTTIPGYQVGNWQKLMADPKNPFSPAYVPAASSVINPGPTSVQNNYATPLYNVFDTMFNINTDQALNLFQQMPSRDIVNLAWNYIKILQGMDIAADEIVKYGDPAFQDAVATVILNKPISV